MSPYNHNQKIVILWGMVALMACLSGIAQSGTLVVATLLLFVLGNCEILVSAMLNGLGNKNFNRFRVSIFDDGYFFYGPVKVTSTPGGAKASIDGDKFCIDIDNHIKCFSAEKYTNYLNSNYAVPYRFIIGSNGIRHVLAYDTRSKRFGLFNPA